MASKPVPIVKDRTVKRPQTYEFNHRRELVDAYTGERVSAPNLRAVQ